MIRSAVFAFALLAGPAQAAEELEYLVSGDPTTVPCVIQIDVRSLNIFWGATPPGVKVSEVVVAIKPTSHPVVSTPCPTVPGLYAAQLFTVDGVRVTGAGATMMFYIPMLPVVQLSSPSELTTR